ncbi:hypothetical protein N657DRAFT_395918 [Parathielavia appendiculata]|uniref:Uncharacterized protein n=1 Tax=Parathielavia appendiculata TaxID=2587402 RepID=A0AAN6U247_9PEZI|nr:hypothetical protein N657DRAFT_395918 [Parathielavia appendiculata]
MAASCALASSAPTEILVRIFQYCDSLADLRAFFSFLSFLCFFFFFSFFLFFLACRHLHAVWVANCPSIIWHVAPKVIPPFDRALIADTFCAEVRLYIQLSSMVVQMRAMPSSMTLIGMVASPRRFRSMALLARLRGPVSQSSGPSST